jgi:hypothetical protein
MHTAVPPPLRHADVPSVADQLACDNDLPMLRFGLAILGAGFLAIVVGNELVIGYVLGGCGLYAIERLVTEVRQLRRQIAK